jgi:hypothetical protein
LRNICRQSLRFPPPSHNFCTPYHDPNSDSGPSSKRKIPTLISLSIIHERLRTFWVQTSSQPLSIARFRPSPNNMTTYQFLPLDHHLPPSEKPTPGSFKLFPNLPLELRRKIWLYAVPRPKNFKLLERNEDDEEVGWTCMTEEERQIPGILFACWESRAETRKFFQLCFEEAAAASPPNMRSAVYVTSPSMPSSSFRASIARRVLLTATLAFRASTSLRRSYLVFNTTRFLSKLTREAVSLGKHTPFWSRQC